MPANALLLSPTAAPGGSERALVGLARQLPNFGITPKAVLLEDGPLRMALEEVGCPVTVHLAGRSRDLWLTYATVRRIAGLARDVDIIISNQTKGHIYGGLAARLAGVPEIWWQQGTASRNRIDLAAAAVPTAAIVCSSKVTVAAQRRITPRRRVELIHLGSALDHVFGYLGSGQVIRDRLGWNGHPVVGIVGRLQPWKGQEVFLRAAGRIAADHPQARFAVVGGAVLGWEGDYPQQLVRLADGLGIASLTTFSGHQDDVYPWFDALDIVVHASFGEPFGLVIVEAMALGKPLVAASSGGPMEIVEDGVSGLLTQPGDDRALAAAIDSVLVDSEYATRLGSAARQRAKTFSEEAMTSNFVSLIQDVTAAHAADSGGLEERTVGGLHEYVLDVIESEGLAGRRAIDLGAGSGALGVRLRERGFDVMTCDAEPNRFGADLPFLVADLDQADFAKSLGCGSFDLVTATEVIEHVEAPISFLRNISELLTLGGIAVVTTPNVDSLPARVKFLMKGKLRLLDEYGDPTHISPIFMDLFLRQYLPRSGLTLSTHKTYPEDGFIVGRPIYRQLLRPFSSVISHQSALAGDNHVFVLRKSVNGQRTPARRVTSRSAVHGLELSHSWFALSVSKLKRLGRVTSL